MWKIALAFIVFAGLALFVLSRGGDIDLSGEKHGIDTHDAAPAASAAFASGTTAAAAASTTLAASAASGQ